MIDAVAVGRDDRLLYSLILAVGFPLTAVLLGEAIHRLGQRQREIASVFSGVRNFVLPSLVIFLLVRLVLRYPEDHQLSRWTATLLWIFLIHSTLAALNVLFFSAADRDSWRAQVPALLRDLSRFFLVAVGAALVLSKVWGADLGRLLTALGVGSIVLGLALQDTLGNIFSGVTLLFERSLRVGDWLEVDGKAGEVMEINWRAIHLRSFDGDLLIIPNSVLSKEVLCNYSSPHPVHAECMSFAFSREDPPNRVKRVLQEVAEGLSSVLTDPEPVILTEKLDEQIRYQIKLYISSFEHSLKVRDQMTTRLWYAAQRYQLELAPGEAMSEPAVAENSDLARRLADVPFLRQIGAERLNDLARSVRIEPFGDGERLIRQGERGRAFFILLGGEVAIRRQTEGGRETELARLGSGEFFGEMSLLLNEPSSASVVATQDVEAIALSAADLHGLLEAVPDLARSIGQAIQSRRQMRVRPQGKRLSEGTAGSPIPVVGPAGKAVASELSGAA